MSNETTEAELWKFMEDWMGIHRTVEFLYVVDGYHASLTDNDGATEVAVAGGKTLREAVCALRKNSADVVPIRGRA